jgi:hypothetical protein
MDFASIYFNLKRCLQSDPDYIPYFQSDDETDSINDEWKELNLVDNQSDSKRPRLDLNLNPKNSPSFHRSYQDWKLIFEIDDLEYNAIKLHSHNLLNEIFVLTYDWQIGEFYSIMYNNDSANEAISRAFPFRNSIFNTPLKAISADLKCPLTQLPCVIVELMRFLAQPECLKTLGAFRVDALDSKTSQLEHYISSGIEGFSTFDLSLVSTIGKMSLLKRFFRNIPGQLINRSLTNLMYQISLAFDNSPCLNSIIRWILSCLSLENYKALAFLCLLLNSYAKNESFNLMEAESLAICWGPIVFDVEANVKIISRITKLLALFIKNWDKFFLYPLK